MSRFNDEELRMLQYGAPIILGMLRRKEAEIISKIYGEFKTQGKLEQTANLAAFCAVRDQINEITAALKLQDKGEG